MITLRNGSKGHSNPGFLDCESDILPLSYGAALPMASLRFRLTCNHTANANFEWEWLLTSHSSAETHKEQNIPLIKVPSEEWNMDYKSKSIFHILFSELF